MVLRVSATYEPICDSCADTSFNKSLNCSSPVICIWCGMPVVVELEEISIFSVQTATTTTFAELVTWKKENMTIICLYLHGHLLMKELEWFQKQSSL